MFLYHKYKKDSYLYDLYKIYYLLTLKVSNENIHNILFYNIYVVKLFYHKTLIKTLMNNIDFLRIIVLPLLLLYCLFQYKLDMHKIVNLFEIYII